MGDDSTSDQQDDLGFLAESTPPSSIRFKSHWGPAFIDTAHRLGIQLVCAGGSGALAKTAVAPLERVKVLLQVQPMSTTAAASQYKGLMDALRRIPQQEGGWRALYRGNGANVLRLLPEVCFKFALADQFRVIFAPTDGSPLGLKEKAAAGAATGLIKTLLFYPLDLCRTRITADTSAAGEPRRYGSVRHCVARTLREEGVRGLYRGLGLSLPGVVLYTSASLTVYDELKHRLPSDKRSKEQWWFPLLKMGAGAAAGVSAQTLSYPLDTVRRRMQMTGAAGTPAPGYRGALHCARSMLAREGGRAFFAGLGVNCLKIVPGAAVQFVAYDLLRVGITYMDPTSGAVSPL